MAKGDTVHDAQPGDTVRFKTPQGQVSSGPVIMKFATHVVLGGKHKMGKVVDESNFINLRRMPGRKVQSDFVTKFL